MDVSADKQRIDSLGGPARLAARLGYRIQRVHNWVARGIPASVKVEHPDLFLRPLEELKAGETGAATATGSP